MWPPHPHGPRCCAGVQAAEVGPGDGLLFRRPRPRLRNGGRDCTMATTRWRCARPCLGRAEAWTWLGLPNRFADTLEQLKALLRPALSKRHQRAVRSHLRLLAAEARFARLGALLRAGDQSHLALLAAFFALRGLRKPRDLCAAAGQAGGRCGGLPADGRRDGGGGDGAVAVPRRPRREQGCVWNLGYGARGPT